MSGCHMQLRIFLIFFWVPLVLGWVSVRSTMKIGIKMCKFLGVSRIFPVNPTKKPMCCDTDLDMIPIPEKPDLIYISKCQKRIGELMFIDSSQVQRYSMHSMCYRVILLGPHLSMTINPNIHCVTCGPQACQYILVYW